MSFKNLLLNLFAKMEIEVEEEDISREIRGQILSLKIVYDRVHPSQFHGFTSLGDKIVFWSNEVQTPKGVKLKSIEPYSEKTDYHRRRFWWKADFNEYMKVYNSDNLEKFLEKEASQIINLLHSEDNYDAICYNYHSAISWCKVITDDANEKNEEVPEDVKMKMKEVLSSFYEDLKEERDKYKKIKETIRRVAEQNYINILEKELKNIKERKL